MWYDGRCDGDSAYAATSGCLFGTRLDVGGLRFMDPPNVEDDERYGTNGLNSVGLLAEEGCVVGKLVELLESGVPMLPSLACR